MSGETNYDGRLEAMANYCKAMYNNIAKVNNAYNDAVENAYTKSLPNKYLDFFGLKKIGGRTILWNQIVDPDILISRGTVSSVGLTLNAASDGSITVSGTSLSSNNLYFCQTLTLKSAHKYYLSTDKYGAGYYVRVGSADSSSTKNGAAIFNVISGSSNNQIQLVFDSGVTFDDLKLYVCIYDLTEMFGAGNEPGTVAEFKAMLSTDIHIYDAGSLLSAGVTDVVSKDSDDTTLQTYTIPEEITTAEGYGWSCPGAYNYIDFETKKFVQAVGIRPYEAGDESDATVITDGTNTHYELDEPLAFDVELPDETITKTEAGGSLTFENQHDGDYNIPVPVELEYIGV